MSDQPRIRSQDLLLVSDAAIRERHTDDPRNSEVNFITHHLNGYNNFMSRGGLKQVITDLFTIEHTLINKRDSTEEDKKIAVITFRVEFTDATVSNPQFDDHWKLKERVFIPDIARQRDLTYDTQINISAKIIAKAYDKKENLLYEKEAAIENHPIGRIPVMVRSEICNTHNKHRAELLAMNEDPQDKGGYFIINGTLWIIKNIESIRFNSPRLFLNIGHKNEVVRCEFISRPGDRFENSAQLIIRLLTDGSLTCEMTIDKSVNKFKEVYIPFYLIFRILGISTDLEILQLITYTDKGTTANRMLEILHKAFTKNYKGFDQALGVREQDKVLQLIYNKTKTIYKPTAGKKVQDEQLSEKNIKTINSYILSVFDKNFLPHVGSLDSDRHNKARYFGYLIHEMLLLLLHPEMVKSTDRDAHDAKRISDAGTSFSKVLKKYLNASIVQPVRARFRNNFRQMAFDKVNLISSFESALRDTDLTKALRQSIISGAKTITIKKQQLTYRLTSQQLHQKNQLNVISSLRDIETPNTSSAKKDVRSDEMRRVHPSFLGYVCFVQSADAGERVGMAKQMAMVTKLTGIGSKDVLKLKLLNPKEKHHVIPLDTVSTLDVESDAKYAKVFVNGEWIGFIQNTPVFLDYWRQQRREQKIHIHTSISYNPIRDTIYFEVDYGRMIIPLLIVKRDAKGVQDILLTPKHLDQLLMQEIDLQHLINQQIVEFIAPEEQLNCMVAESYDVLWQHRKSTFIDYTHCQIPQSMLGLSALTSPYAQMNQAPRNVFQTNQVRQTCGWFALNWSRRIEKNTFIQYRNEIPLVRTIANKYILPNGSNVFLAIMCYTGYNQEDSWIVSQSALDTGLFLGEHFSLERAELEKDDESFGIPDQATKETPRDYCYDKLDSNGFIKPGSIINKGDVLIGKLVKIAKPTGPYTHTDNSIVYKYDEQAYVLRVDTGRNAKDREFCKVIFSSIRFPVMGDKFCLLPTTEVLTTKGWIPIKNVTLNHKVATLVDDVNIEYVNPTELHEFDYNSDIDGKLYQLRSQQVDLTTTPNHKMYVHFDSSNESKLVEVQYLKKMMHFGKNITFRSMNETIPISYNDISNDYDYTGKVYCLTVPSHVFYVRENGKPVWTGNSARSGQKGVIGLRPSRADMPVTESGIVPDIIMNPHAMPTRMTINQEAEMLVGRYCAHRGVTTDGTCFNKVDLDDINEQLIEKGYNPWGEERMYNGMTGAYINVKIYAGPCYYQRLQKFVNDEVFSSATAVTCALTRQPVAGRSKRGGLRIGEMEKDVICAQGSMMFLTTKLVTDSDAFKMYICRHCGKMPIVNIQESLYICRTCGDLADIAVVQTKWSSKLFLQELEGMGIGVRLFLRPYTYERYVS